MMNLHGNKFINRDIGMCVTVCEGIHKHTKMQVGE